MLKRKFDPVPVFKNILEIAKMNFPEMDTNVQVQILLDAMQTLLAFSKFNDYVIVYEEQDAVKLYFTRPKTKEVMEMAFPHISIYVKADSLVEITGERMDKSVIKYPDIPVDAVPLLVSELEKFYEA